MFVDFVKKTFKIVFTAGLILAICGCDNTTTRPYSSNAGYYDIVVKDEDYDPNFLSMYKTKEDFEALYAAAYKTGGYITIKRRALKDGEYINEKADLFVTRSIGGDGKTFARYWEKRVNNERVIVFLVNKMGDVPSIPLFATKEDFGKSGTRCNPVYIHTIENIEYSKVYFGVEGASGAMLHDWRGIISTPDILEDDGSYDENLISESRNEGIFVIMPNDKLPDLEGNDTSGPTVTIDGEQYHTYHANTDGIQFTDTINTIIAFQLN